MKNFILTNDSLGIPKLTFPATSNDWYLEEDTSRAFTLTKDIRSNSEYVFPPTIIIRLNQLTELDTVSPDEYEFLTSPQAFETDSGSYIVTRRAVFLGRDNCSYQIDVIGMCALRLHDREEILTIMNSIEI